MRLYSNKESAYRLEFSVLAAIETVVMVAMSAFVAVNYESYLHVIIGATLAPLLLLKTPNSSELARKYFQKILAYSKKIFEGRVFAYPRATPFIPSALLLVLFIAITILLVKVAVTIFSVIKHPCDSLTSIPNNWYRVALCTDTMHPPEILPDIEKDQSLKDFHFSSLKESMRDDDFVLVFLALVVAVLVYMPAILYRLSLKASSLVYLPLVWISQPPNHRKNSLMLRIDEITLSSLEKIKRCYSWIVITLFTILPIYISYFLQHINIPESSNEIYRYFFPINEINSWHITRFGAAITTIFIFFFSEKLMIRNFREDHSWNEWGLLVITGCTKIRTLFSLWTVGCGIYLMYISVDWDSIPSIRWLP